MIHPKSIIQIQIRKRRLKKGKHVLGFAFWECRRLGGLWMENFYGRLCLCSRPAAGNHNFRANYAILAIFRFFFNKEPPSRRRSRDKKYAALGETRVVPGCEAQMHLFKGLSDYLGSTSGIPPFRNPASATLQLSFQFNLRMDFGRNCSKNERAASRSGPY
jgi:hypothetical protein